MTTYIARTALHHVHAVSQARASGLLHALGRWWEGFRASRARSATAYLLRGLDDRTLSDIGLQRSEIDSIVYSDPSDRRQRFTLPRR